MCESQMRSGCRRSILRHAVAGRTGPSTRSADRRRRRRIPHLCGVCSLFLAMFRLFDLDGGSPVGPERDYREASLSWEETSSCVHLTGGKTDITTGPIPPEWLFSHSGMRPICAVG